MIISDRIGSHIASAMVDAGVISDDKTAIYTYCYSSLLDKLIYILYIALLGILTRHPLSALIILSVLLPLRSTVGGVHADSQIVCSILSFIIPPFMIFISLQSSVLSLEVFVTIYVLSMIIIFIFAPVGNKNRPINNKKRSKLRKILFISSVPISMIFIFLLFTGLNDLSFLTALCTFFCAVSLILGIIKNRRQRICSSI